MDDALRSQIIRDNPVGNGLENFRRSFLSACKGASVPCDLDALEQLGQEDLEDLSLELLSVLQSCRASRILPSSGRGKHLFGDLSRLSLAITSDDFNLDLIKPLLKSAIANDPDDAQIWNQAYSIATPSTPPPRLMTSSFQQTPWLYNTSDFANSSEYRKDVDRVLRNELGTLYVGLPRFHETFFGRVAGLEIASHAVFKKCTEGSEPLFRNGWSGWPTDANQDDVLSWFERLTEQLATFAEEHRSTPRNTRRPLAQPNKPIQGSTAERKLDVGFVDDAKAGKDSRCHWSHILIPGELKSNPLADIASKAWLDIGTYAREVLAAQDTRRFVLGFTICGSLMRVWEFDRLGGIASQQFNINEDGLQFVYTILGFLWMSPEELGFDPTIMTANRERFIEIEKDGRTERLIIDEVMRRARCIAGRATTCWKAHREGHPETPLVIKDSWQYPERNEEGELLRMATGRGVVNVARYYYHETVQVQGTDDDIRTSIRGGLDVTTATNYRSDRSKLPPRVMALQVSQSDSSNSNATGKKRSCGQIGVPLPPSKRPNLASPMKASGDTLSNRVHRRVILRDYGKPIYKAGSHSALLLALEGCIEAHKSLRRKVGILHRDISINNLIINEDDGNLSWSSFLIDLDLAVREQREGVSGAEGKTGTRAFMAIGALLGEEHSFMHDLESFFWVLFWICIHYNAQGKGIGPTGFERWNYESDNNLVQSKIGTVHDETFFLKLAAENFTSYYQPLILLVNKLRKKVFPNGMRWKRLEPELYSSMKEILREARKDPNMMTKGG